MIFSWNTPTMYALVRFVDGDIPGSDHGNFVAEQLGVAVGEVVEGALMGDCGCW